MEMALAFQNNFQGLFGQNICIVHCLTIFFTWTLFSALLQGQADTV